MEYTILQDIQDQHFKDCCQELFCNETPTKIMILVIEKIHKVNLFLCDEHARQFQSCLNQTKS
jgi:hypothetical protein